MRQRARRAFTIIELLVVISIIALLISILLPAVGKARDNAKVAVSRSNLRQLGMAMHQYSADWEDRQYQVAVDTLASYGSVGNYNTVVYEDIGPSSRSTSRAAWRTSAGSASPRASRFTPTWAGDGMTRSSTHPRIG
jgi:prepilin-type N-terminal cleavage/methylation domain-containing protein